MTLGYFKARRKFFARQFVQTDIEFVTHQVGAKLLEVSVENYDKATYLRHQRLILQHFGYQAFDEFARTFILSEIQSLVRAQHRPKLIFLETVQILTRKKIVIPTYNLLAKLWWHSLSQLISPKASRNYILSTYSFSLDLLPVSTFSLFYLLAQCGLMYRISLYSNISLTSPLKEISRVIFQ